MTALAKGIRHGVKVRSVFPGAVYTPILRYEGPHALRFAAQLSQQRVL